MRVEELYQQLSYGELSDLSLGVEGTGTIRKVSQPRIIHHANEALTRLHTRFLLQEKEAAVVLIEGIEQYDLLVEDAIKILAVYASNGASHAVQDGYHSEGISAPQATLLRVPYVSSRSRDFPPGSTLKVIYQANHPRLDPEALDQEIELPGLLEQALRAYVAGMMFGNTDKEASARHLARYHEICNEAPLTGLTHTGGITTTTRFDKGGWV